MSIPNGYTPIIHNSRKLRLPTAIMAPAVGAPAVLTNVPWEFVDLYLAKQTQANAIAKEARFYWSQAREFYDVAAGMSLRCAPLLLYYAFMNATKALLSVKQVAFCRDHGVTRDDQSCDSSGVQFSHLGVQFKKNKQGKHFGIAHSLSQYHLEREYCDRHSLRDVLYNLPFVHRTYHITFPGQPELFLPLKPPRFVTKEGTNDVVVLAKLENEHSIADMKHVLPETIEGHSDGDGDFVVSKTPTSISSSIVGEAELQQLGASVRILREGLSYIAGVDTLWYLKLNRPNAPILQRQSLTLMFLAMHRLSELCRYSPDALDSLLNGEQNWLLSEFIRMSGPQFVDQIASEITGMTFLPPSVRPAK